MKQNIKVSGEIELSQDEALAAMFEYLKKEKKLQEAISGYISENLGYSTTRVASSKNKEGELVVVCQVNQVNNDGIKTIFHMPKNNDSGAKKQPSGFKRRNVGFYRQLTEYLHEERDKKSRKQLPFSEAYNMMKFSFPSLTERNFMIYASDKRQQKSKGFRFDGKKRMFLL